MPPRTQSDAVLLPLKPTGNEIGTEILNDNESEKNNGAKIATAKNLNEKKEAPWYRRGGMDVNMVGMAFNITLPVLILLQDVDKQWQKYYAAVWALCLTLSALPPCNMRTVYCIVVVPTFFTSLSLAFTLNSTSPIKTAILSLIYGATLAIFKVNICMSVCLHRYAAHHAFKTKSNLTSLFLQILGCLANQGGCIWWSSQHKCHHKYCDLPDKDPHSPMHMGVEDAFSFFQIHTSVREMFVPRYLDSVMNRVLDTWSFLVVSLELYLSFVCFGPFGLFVSYTSGWLCQSITLWFNIVNHPPNDINTTSTNIKDTCQAVNTKDPKVDKSVASYLPFQLLTILHPLFALFVMESEHEHHHDHSTLAKRSWYDVAYWGFIKPMECLGLIYDVQV